MTTGQPCACLSSDARACIELRYRDVESDEECECACHERDEDEVDGAVLDQWPNCATPDCENKACLWAGTEGRCYPCSVRLVGEAEMQRRYEMTRAADGSWNGVVPRTESA